MTLAVCKFHLRRGFLTIGINSVSYTARVVSSYLRNARLRRMNALKPILRASKIQRLIYLEWVGKRSSNEDRDTRGGLFDVHGTCREILT